MRPCNNCGAPIENRLLYCENCKDAVPAETLREDARQGPDAVPTRMELFWFAIELVIRTVIVACPITVVLSFLLMLALPVATALIVAVAVSMVAGFGWSILELYFKSGPH